MFDKNIPAPNAKVIVLDENEKALVEGKTDEEGRWSFALPPPGNYQVKVNAGAGHRKTVTLKVGGTDDAETDSASPITDQETWTDSLWLRAALGVLVIVLLGLGLKWLLPKRGKELRSEVR